MIAKLKDLLRGPGGEWVVSFTTRADPRQIFDEFTDKPVSVEIKKASKSKSGEINRFLWAMCTDIGNAMNPPVPKEEVYKQAIRDVGKFDTLHVREEAVEEFRRAWKGDKVGWFTEVIDYSQFPGYKVVLAYYGTSVYNMDEMRRLVSLLKQDMENMNLPIPVSKEEEERLLSAWGRALCKKTAPATSAES